MCRLINDRPQGATSVGTGEIEIMITRRVTGNDQRGNPESLDEKGTHHFERYLTYINRSLEFVKNYQTKSTMTAPQRVKCTHHYLFSKSSNLHISYKLFIKIPFINNRE